MQVLFKIDQVEAFRRGLFAPSSTARVVLHPENFTDEEREILASSTGGPSLAVDASFPSILTPDVPGVKAAVAQIVAKKQAELVQKLQARQEADAVIEAYLRNPETYEATEWVRLGENGRLQDWGGVVTKEVKILARKGPPFPHQRDIASPEVRERLAVFDRDLAVRRQVRLDRAHVELLPELEAWRAAKAQREKDAMLELSFVVASWPEVTRARYVANLMGSDELTSRIGTYARAQLFAEPEDYADFAVDGSRFGVIYSRSDEMDDASFDAMRRLVAYIERGSMAGKAKVEPVVHDEDSTIYAALVEWTFAGREIRALVPLDEDEPIDPRVRSEAQLGEQTEE